MTKQIPLLKTPYPGPWNNSILYQEGSEIFGESLTDKYKMVQGVQDLELIGAIVNFGFRERVFASGKHFALQVDGVTEDYPEVVGDMQLCGMFG